MMYVTNLGIELKYHGAYSPTQNLFYQLFGRWPKHDCEGWRRKFLLAMLWTACKDKPEFWKFFRLKEAAIGDIVGVFENEGDVLVDQIPYVEQTESSETQDDQDEDDKFQSALQIESALVSLRDYADRRNCILVLFDEHPEYRLGGDVAMAIYRGLISGMNTVLMRWVFQEIMQLVISYENPSGGSIKEAQLGG